MNTFLLITAIALIAGIASGVALSTSIEAAGPDASTRCTNNLNGHIAADSRNGAAAQQYKDAGLCTGGS